MSTDFYCVGSIGAAGHCGPKGLSQCDYCKWRVTDRVTEKVRAPWTKAQVAALNKWQKLGYVHEFNCPCCSGQALLPTKLGWHCENCSYRQNWAHDFMCDQALHPKPPFGV